MKAVAKICTTLLFVSLLSVPIMLISGDQMTVEMLVNPVLDSTQIIALIQNDSALVPLQRAAFIAHDSDSYIDDFAYMAAVPTGVFSHSGTRYVSPVIFVSGSESEQWLVEDWAEYLNADGGVTQAISVGDIHESTLLEIQETLGTRVYPRITGTTPADIAAKLAVSEWSSTDTVVLALAETDFEEPSLTEGSFDYQFLNRATDSSEFLTSITSDSPHSIDFAPPSWAGWIEGSFNWTGPEIMTHTLVDPFGNVVDYSVYVQILRERSTSSVPSPMPLLFWIPRTSNGTWSMVIDPVTVVTDDIEVDYTLTYHPGFSRTIDVPASANWLNVSLSWDNAATDLNLALIDPDGRLAFWAPIGSPLSQPGGESIEFPYPMAGEWTVVAAWLDASAEQNNVDLDWSISTIADDIQYYLESASNGAVLASLLNVPLLYVTETEIPQITQWAINRLGASNLILVDPGALQSSSLTTALSSLGLFVNISTYPGMTSMIRALSGENDIVVTLPIGDGKEFFGPATYSGAFHGAPVFSLCGDDNVVPTRASETWAPYLIGPEIEIYITSRYTTRTENGWYDERIPNKYSMMESADEFTSFVTDRGAYNASATQSVVVVSPVDILKVSFDRSLQSHFSPGRIPSNDPAMASVMINRGSLHRFLYLTADARDSTLLTLYAYTYGGIAVDNDLNAHQIYQIEQIENPLEAAGFTIEPHIGRAAVFSTLASQVAFWSMSTHGTLTELPTDPPLRPNGPGMFSLRDTDLSYGMETATERDHDPPGSVGPDGLVNPVLYSENSHHILVTTAELDASLGNIGSPIVHITACLLGGSRMPEMLMEHGAVGVMAAPRTVYFRAAGLLSIFFTEELAAGNSTGTSLNYALTSVSADYTDPIVGRDPQDYANQQVLYGDPEVHLYYDTTSPRIPGVDPTTTSFDQHIPGRGVIAVAGLGSSSYLPSALSSIGIEFDYYETSNYSDFSEILSLRRTVLVEPGVLSTLQADLSSDQANLERFVNDGGSIVLLGVSGNLSWFPWPLTHDSSSTGSEIVIDDSDHPLVTVPNILGSIVGYEGHFSSVWSNFSVIATDDSSNPVIVAGAIGSGKVAVTTTHPTGLEQSLTLSNAVRWSEEPSLILKNARLSQVIIWEGDYVGITLEIKDLYAENVLGIEIEVWLNSTSVTATQDEPGVFTIDLDGDWTTGRTGTFNLLIHAWREGYDTLTLEIPGFIYIRPSPLPLLLVGGGVLATIVIGYVYMKRRRGESIFSRDRGRKDGRFRDKSEEERRTRREKDERFDAREVFDV